jgi:peptidyl-tRNA hydrolase
MPNQILYIIMRSDLDSMNPGKAVAQGSHATTIFENHLNALIKRFMQAPAKESFKNMNEVKISNSFVEWKKQAKQGYGTTIVLASPSMDDIRGVVDKLNDNGYCAEVVNDPTYPIRDGSFVHYIPLDTCAYAFIYDASDPLSLGRELLSQFDLHC